LAHFTLLVPFPLPATGKLVMKHVSNEILVVILKLTRGGGLEGLDVRPAPTILPGPIGDASEDIRSHVAKLCAREAGWVFFAASTVVG
jgi:hypothetical protein